MLPDARVAVGRGGLVRVALREDDAGVIPVDATGIVVVVVVVVTSALCNPTG